MRKIAKYYSMAKLCFQYKIRKAKIMICLKFLEEALKHRKTQKKYLLGKL